MKATFKATDGTRTLKIIVIGNDVCLEGTLIGNDDGRICMRRAMEYMSSSQPSPLSSNLVTKNPRWTVDVSGCWVTQEGLKVWVREVSDHLPGHHLHYGEGDLSVMLQRNYKDREQYRLRDASFVRILL
jgi:hypothetical protein